MDELQNALLKIVELEQQVKDLNIELNTAIEHGDSVDEQLFTINNQLQNEVQDRIKAESVLNKMAEIIKSEKADLELLVETVTQHSDMLDTQWLQQYETAKNDAITDSLTTIPNRRYFNQYITREWDRAIKKRYPIALAMIDIDHFKLYNDTYGHVMGDECLREVALALSRACKRSSDFVARYGGEEFVIVISSASNESIIKTSESIHDEIAKIGCEHKASLTNKMVTVSAGIALMQPMPECNEQQFINYADNLLYRAKRNGRNRSEITEVTTNILKNGPEEF